LADYAVQVSKPQKLIAINSWA